ncbi:cytochrome c550 [Ornithinibacillus halophilus]|uniref:Cytochrome c551/cytochrome c550 n=1 Tax=Ornithinibacillus halophilus TaxID=930117 RepID=A0A1M5DNG4_9BACI|nr:cytochrome c [Ornithinibacillus halophilus]SHF68568.1 cytochrome c551/cytochrome c550 [Ornithinibacillus halophilus]
MRKNAVIPYAIIAIVGIIAVIVISLVGVDQRKDLANQDEQGGETQEGEVASPEVIYENNCAMCHGADLSGGSNPDLTTIGAKLSVDEIASIIQNGQGGMPAQSHLSQEEVDALSEWLGEKQ